jgi:ribosomal protein L11 methyltransferase
MKSSGNTTVARLICDEGTAKRVANLLSESLEASEGRDRGIEATDAQWGRGGSFRDAARRAGAATAGRDGDGRGAGVDTIEPKDWVAASLADLKPVIAGRFTSMGHTTGQRWRRTGIGIEIEARWRSEPGTTARRADACWRLTGS